MASAPISSARRWASRPPPRPDISPSSPMPASSSPLARRDGCSTGATRQPSAASSSTSNPVCELSSMPLSYVHVDVFAQRPFSGNSLPVFPNAQGLSGAQMQRITQELRHFESIFLEPTAEPNRVRARVFDLFEEL